MAHFAGFVPLPCRLRLAEVTGDVHGYVPQADGAWADSVERNFGFLLDAGFRPTELLFHHEGDSIELTGPNGAIVFEFGPQFGMIAAWAQLTSYVGSLEDLPGGGPAPVGIGELPVTISPEAVEAWNKRWAEKLRANIHLIS